MFVVISLSVIVASEITWSPVLAPEIETTQFTVKLGEPVPACNDIPFTVVGVMFPRARVIVGVVLALATEPDIPLALAIDTVVTVPVVGSLIALSSRQTI